MESILAQVGLAVLTKSSTRCPMMSSNVAGPFREYAPFPVPISKLLVQGKVVEQLTEEFVEEAFPRSGMRPMVHLEEVHQLAYARPFAVPALSELRPSPRIDCQCDQG